MVHPRLDQQPRLRHDGDGGAVRPRPVLVQPAAGRAAARHRAADRLRRRRLSGRLARRHRDRADPADRAGAERHRRHQDDPLEQPRGAERDGGRVPAQRRHEPRGAGRARQGRDGAAELPARCQAALRLALRRRQRPADGLPLPAQQGPERARAVAARRPGRQEAPRALDRRRSRRRRRPDGAPGADRPRSAAPARLPADARRRVAGAAARQLRHAGRPAHRHQGRRDRARRGQGQGRQGVRRRGRRQPQRHGGPARRPRHAGRARARAGLDLARRRRAGDLVPGLQAAGREHRRDRPGDQGRRRGAEEGPAARASSCAWSMPTATGWRARSTASSTR